MNRVVVDVEADGPIPGEYSMVSVGAVVVEPSLQETLYGQVTAHHGPTLSQTAP